MAELQLLYVNDLDDGTRPPKDYNGPRFYSNFQEPAVWARAGQVDDVAGFHVRLISPRFQGEFCPRLSGVPDL